MGKIFFLANGISRVGGIEQFNRHFLKALTANFSEPEVTTLFLDTRKQKREAFWPKGKENRARAKSWRTPLFRKGVFFLTALLQCCRKKPRLIICGHVHLSPVALFLKAIFGVPYAVIVHGVDVWRLNSGLRYQGLRKADVVVAVSDHTRSRMIANGISKEKTIILHNTVDTIQFAPRIKNPDMVEALRLSGKRVLLTVSRIEASEKDKGHFVMLKTLQLLNDDYVWLVVGGGSALSVLKKYAQDLGVASKIRFIGAVESDSLVDYYNLCDVFILPSKKEGFGIVFLEAMACGKPVIAGDKDGSREPLRNGDLGFLVDPDDLGKIAETIQSVFNEQSLKKDPVYLRKMVETHFGIVGFQDEVKETFGKFLNA